MNRAKIENARVLAGYIGAGGGKITIRSVKTGTRYTYKFRVPKGDDPNKPIFVSLLNGPDNESCFTYIGCIWGRGDAMTFNYGHKSKVGRDASSVKAFEWMFRRMLAGKDMAGIVEVWHEGVCGKCGRALTVPESIQAGLGPVCRSYGFD